MTDLNYAVVELKKDDNDTRAIIVPEKLSCVIPCESDETIAFISQVTPEEVSTMLYLRAVREELDATEDNFLVFRVATAEEHLNRRHTIIRAAEGEIEFRASLCAIFSKEEDGKENQSILLYRGFVEKCLTERLPRKFILAEEPDRFVGDISRPYKELCSCLLLLLCY